MKNLHSIFIYFSLLLAFPSCAQPVQDIKSHTQDAIFEFQKSDEYWKTSLSPMAYNVLRAKGTERAFSGELNNNKRNGTYLCAGCENPLFESGTKFDSGTGWPSFFTCIGDTNVVEQVDTSHGWNRVEVLCGKCGGHLGHVFEDGPQPTGLRYCVNSVSLRFEEEKE